MQEKEPEAQDRIELMPHMDLWMRGAKFGTVEKIVIIGGLVKYKIQLDALSTATLFSRNQFKVIN